MPLGPRKYEDLYTQVREQAQARSAMVFILNGTSGSGFSVQADLATHVKLPEIFENVAAQIRAALREGDL
jgi:hypothetical protein